MNQKIKVIIIQGERYHSNLAKLQEWAQQQTHFESFIVKQEDWKTNKIQTLAVQYPDVQAIVIPQFASKELGMILDLFKQIKWIHVFSAGVDSYIKYFTELQHRNIVLTNMKQTSSIQLAEFAVLGALYFTKNTLSFIKSAEKGKWFDKPVNMNWLHHKTAMVVGLGGIGTEIAKKLFYGFDMNIIGIKRQVNNLTQLQQQITQKIITLDEIEDNIQDVDYLIFSLPSIDKPILTKNLLNKMSKSMIIINVGRGGVIDEEVLFEGIRQGKINGAALDVWNEEPLSQDNPFFKEQILNEKILSFCHFADVGDFTTKIRIETYADMIKAFMNGKFINVVDYNLCY